MRICDLQSEKAVSALFCPDPAFALVDNLVLVSILEVLAGDVGIGVGEEPFDLAFDLLVGVAEGFFDIGGLESQFDVGFSAGGTEDHRWSGVTFREQSTARCLSTVVRERAGRVSGALDTITTL